MSRSVLVLVGPTGSGKTPVSLLLAKHLDAEILSADSRQVYKLLDIGTAKPGPEELASVRHYFVDELMPEEKFDAAGFGERGRNIIDDLFRRKKVPIVVGGSGLYVQALVDGFFEGPPADDSIREELEARFAKEGGGGLLEELRRVDPEAAGRMLPSHSRRIIRALEVYRLTGIPISRLQEARIEINFDPVFVGLRWDRAALYDRINRRVDAMIELGLVDEIQRLRDSGYSQLHRSLHTVGYKEIFDFLDGKQSLARAVELIKQNSRRYAKRQLTWFRADERITWFDVEGEGDFPGVAESISRHFLQSL